MDRKVETIRMKYVPSIYIKYVNESEREREIIQCWGYRGEGERKRQEERERKREREKERERERKRERKREREVC
jgi:hypothetical protein